MLEKENLLNKEELISFLENQIRICSTALDKEKYSDRLFFLNSLVAEIKEGRFDFFDNTPQLYLEKLYKTI